MLSPVENRNQFPSSFKKLKLISLKNKQLPSKPSLNTIIHPETHRTPVKDQISIHLFNTKFRKNQNLQKSFLKKQYPLLLNSTSKPKSIIPQQFIIKPSTHRKSNSYKQNSYSSTLTSFPSIYNNHSNIKTRNHNINTNFYFFSKKKMLTDTNEKLNSVETNCTNIFNEISVIKKPIDDKSKVYVVENINDVINNEIKKYVRDEPKVDEVSLKSQMMVDKSEYASKMNEKFAYDAEDIVYEIFNKEYIMKKKEMQELNKRRRSMIKKRLILRIRTDDLLKDYNNTIMRCYKTLDCK